MHCVIIVIHYLAFAVSHAIMSESVLHVCREVEALLVLFDPIRNAKMENIPFTVTLYHIEVVAPMLRRNDAARA